MLILVYTHTSIAIYTTYNRIHTQSYREIAAKVSCIVTGQRQAIAQTSERGGSGEVQRAYIQ